MKHTSTKSVKLCTIYTNLFVSAVCSKDITTPLFNPMLGVPEIANSAYIRKIKPFTSEDQKNFDQIFRLSQFLCLIHCCCKNAAILRQK